MNILTDQQLLRDYTSRQSEAAFAELVRRHVDFIYSAALRMVCDAPLAQDVTQGVFVALAQNARQLTDHPVLTCWLHRTAQNLAAKAVRSDVRRRAREHEAAIMNELLSAEPDAVWEQIAPQLDAALGELVEADRGALLLRFFQNHDFRTIGVALGVSDDAAQKRVSRALERLRAEFHRRGVTTTAVALSAAVSANAIQAAPVGLAVAISTAAALAGTTIASAATQATMHWINLKSISAVVATAIAVGTSTYLIQHREKSRLQNENATLVAQRDKLVADHDATLASAAGDAEELDRLRKDRSELLRLRGEVGVLRKQPMGLEKLGNENRPPSVGEESKGGLVGIALRPSDLGSGWTRSIVLLFDPLSNPPEIFSLVTNAMRRGHERLRTAAEIAEAHARQTEENRKFLRSTLSQIGAEAKIILEYRNPEYERNPESEQSFTMTIYRSKTSEAADSQWRIRHTNEEFKSATVAGADVIFVKQGQVFPGPSVASKPVVELREGIFLIEVGPGNPEPGDPGFNLARQQVERIRQHPELVSSLSDVPRPGQKHQEPSPQTASPPTGGNQPSVQKTSTAEIDGINIISVPLGQAVPIYAAFSGTEVDVDENVNQLLNLIQFRLVNTNAMTRSEAVALFDQAFREQAGVEITHPATNRAVLRLRRK